MDPGRSSNRHCRFYCLGALALGLLLLGPHPGFAAGKNNRDPADIAVLGPVPPFEDGLSAYEKSDYKTAYDVWIQRARRNDLAAMRNVGHLLRWGLGVEQDKKRALWFYEMAADSSLISAMYNAAMMLLEGDGVAQDDERGAQWLYQAALGGHVQSQHALARLYEHGRGLEQNPARALGWYYMAARGGHEKALERVGELTFELPDEALADNKPVVAVGLDGEPYKTKPPVIKEMQPNDQPDQNGSLALESIPNIKPETEDMDIPVVEKNIFEILFPLEIVTPKPRHAPVTEYSVPEPAPEPRSEPKPEPAATKTAQTPVPAVKAEAESRAVSDGILPPPSSFMVAAYPPSLDKLQAEASSGQSEAQFQLGNRYAKGDGVIADLPSAYIWWRKAAASGHRGALDKLNELYGSMSKTEIKALNKKVGVY